MAAGPLHPIALGYRAAPDDLLRQATFALNAKRPRSIGRGFVDEHLKRAQKDPYGTAVGAHKFAKNVKRAAKVGSLAVAVA